MCAGFCGAALVVSGLAWGIATLISGISSDSGEANRNGVIVALLLQIVLLVWLVQRAVGPHRLSGFPQGLVVGAALFVLLSCGCFGLILLWR